MSHPRADMLYRMSMTWARDAESYRTDKRPTVAHYALRRHIELREESRRLAKQEKKP